MILLGLAPDGFRLRLNTGVGVKQRDGAVENAQRTLNFNGEVDVAGGVDDVEAAHLAVATLPEGRGGSGGDGDTTLLLLFHPVHRGCAIVNFTDLVRLTGVIKDTLGGRRLAGVDMRHDTEIAVVFDFIFASHNGLPFDMRPVKITSGNARMRGWRRPSCACLRAS
ncbi:hypothetical protein D3C71_901070 [compost metagenome]